MLTSKCLFQRAHCVTHWLTSGCIGTLSKSRETIGIIKKKTDLCVIKLNNIISRGGGALYTNVVIRRIMIVCMAHAIQLKNYTLIWIRKQKADDLKIRNCRATNVLIRLEDIQLDFWHGQESNRLYWRSEKTTSVIQIFNTKSNNATHCKHISMGAYHLRNCFHHSNHRI